MASNAHNESASISNPSIIEQVLTCLCCKLKKNKVNPVTKKETKTDHRSISPPSGVTIKRSPTPGPEGRTRQSEDQNVEVKVKEERRVEEPPTVEVVEDRTEEITESSSIELPIESEPASEATLPEIDIPLDDVVPEISEVLVPEISLRRGFHSDSTLSITDRPRIRPDGAGIRSGAVSGSHHNPFPEYDFSGSTHSEHNNSYCSSEVGISLKELEEDELDIDDWGEGFDSDRTPRAASMLTMQSNTETIRKRGLFQNKKSQAIETPPSSDRRNSEDGENGSHVFQRQTNDINDIDPGEHRDVV